MVDVFYPIEWLSNAVIRLFNLDPASKFGSAMEFFIYDTIKILVLVFVMIFIMGFLRTYISRKKIRDWLTGKKMGLGNLAASVFGALTPFCTCSSIPIFLSFLRAGIPTGIVFSFLITSPILNEYLAVLMFSFFGWKVTLLYIVFGITLGTVGGIILGKLGVEKYIIKDMSAVKMREITFTLKDRVRFGYLESKNILRKIWLWILLGVGVGALIHGFIPEEMIQTVLERGGVFAVPAAVLIGIPLYAHCAAVIPIAVVLFEKGFPLGTALAFMMATTSLSFPEAVILKRAMKWQLIAIFFGITGLGIILIGYLFNLVIL